MWSYYGSKSRVVDYYPKPKHNKIIEPFAGSARYSLKWFENDVLLVDKFELIVKIWKWLQKCSIKDIETLPNLKTGETIQRKDFDCDEQFWLMGFIVQQGVNAPRKTVSKLAEPNIPRQKRNVSEQLYKIKHWNIVHGDYREIENQKATWFIDPPYQFGGEYYVKNNKNWDYSKLAEWCKKRKGHIIVCENTKADWLPFVAMKAMNGTIHETTEAIWSNEKTAYDYEQLNLAI